MNIPKLIVKMHKLCHKLQPETLLCCHSTKDQFNTLYILQEFPGR